MLSDINQTQFPPISSLNSERANREVIRSIASNFQPLSTLDTPISKEQKWHIDLLHCERGVARLTDLKFELN